jgi:hypothetical protein
MTIRKNLNRMQLREVRATTEHLDLAAAAARCGHIKPNGLPCGSPALTGSVFCYYHDQHYNRPDQDAFPPLENADAIQVALNQVLDRLRGEIFRRLDTQPRSAPLDIRAFNSLLYGLQTASANAKRTRFDASAFRDNMVTTLSSPPAKPPASVADDDEVADEPVNR